MRPETRAFRADDVADWEQVPSRTFASVRSNSGSKEPAAASQKLRDLETLPPRIPAQEESARKIARFLEGHPLVTRVWWPGLAPHPRYGLARQQMASITAAISFTTKSPKEDARLIRQRARLLRYGWSPGRTCSLISFIGADHGWSDAQARNLPCEIGDGVFLLSVGLEDADDIIADLERAMDRGRVRPGGIL